MFTHSLYYVPIYCICYITSFYGIFLYFLEEYFLNFGNMYLGKYVLG